MLSVSHGSNTINFQPHKRFDVVRVLATAPKGSRITYAVGFAHATSELITSWKKTAKKFGYGVHVLEDKQSFKTVIFEEIA